jgi:hypothetical protein
MWVTFWNTSSTCLIVALNVNSYKSILKSITDRAANLTIKHLWTFAMDQGEYSGNVYAQCCCVPIDDWTRAISEQWTLAHYSSRERLINESHKLSPLAPLCTMVKLMVRQCCLIDAHTFGSLWPVQCCCWLGSSYGPDRYPPLVSTRAHSTSTYLLSISSNCHHVLTYRLFCVHLTYLSISV